MIFFQSSIDRMQVRGYDFLIPHNIQSAGDCSAFVTSNLTTKVLTKLRSTFLEPILSSKCLKEKHSGRTYMHMHIAYEIYVVL